MKEIWKDVGECKGYEKFKGLYEVSNLGRVRSLNGILSPSSSNSGYLGIQLYLEGSRVRILIHRLVALAFIPNPNNLPEVNHIDEDKTNNKVSNLEWCTHKYNVGYGTRGKRAGIKISDKVGKPVNQYDKQGNLLHMYKSSIDAGKQFSAKTAYSNINKCLTGKTKTAYGYVWKYTKEVK